MCVCVCVCVCIWRRHGSDRCCIMTGFLSPCDVKIKRKWPNADPTLALHWRCTEAPTWRVCVIREIIQCLQPVVSTEIPLPLPRQLLETKVPFFFFCVCPIRQRRNHHAAANAAYASINPFISSSSSSFGLSHTHIQEKKKKTTS